MRAWAAAACLTTIASCGGGGGGGTPTTPTPSPSTPPPASWSLSGEIVTTLAGTPVAGATVIANDLRAVTDAAGRFELRRDSAPVTPLTLRVETQGYLTRETRVTHPRSAALRIDQIRDAAPFDLPLYRALVHGSEHTPDLWANARWSMPATFYLQLSDDTGRRVEPEVVALVKSELSAAWSAWTGGKYAAVIQEGEAERADAAGLVRVLFARKREGLVCGMATVGGNSGWMRFYLDGCDCGSRKVDPAVVWHEVGHTAGFGHTSGRYLMSPRLDELCNRRAEVTDAELHHARIAYERPRGNMDPDRDPASFSMIMPEGTKRHTVACATR